MDHNLLGLTVNDQWCITELICRSGFSDVYRGHLIDDEKEQVAIKISEAGTMCEELLQWEIEVYKKIGKEGLSQLQLTPSHQFPSQIDTCSSLLSSVPVQPLISS